MEQAAQLMTDLKEKLDGWTNTVSIAIWQMKPAVSRLPIRIPGRFGQARPRTSDAEVETQYSLTDGEHSETQDFVEVPTESYASPTHKIVVTSKPDQDLMGEDGFVDISHIDPSHRNNDLSYAKLQLVCSAIARNKVGPYTHTLSCEDFHEDLGSYVITKSDFDGYQQICFIYYQFNIDGPDEEMFEGEDFQFAEVGTFIFEQTPAKYIAYLPKPGESKKRGVEIKKLSEYVDERAMVQHAMEVILQQNLPAKIRRISINELQKTNMTLIQYAKRERENYKGAKQLLEQATKEKDRIAAASLPSESLPDAERSVLLSRSMVQVQSTLDTLATLSQAHASGVGVLSTAPGSASAVGGPGKPVVSSFRLSSGPPCGLPPAPSVGSQLGSPRGLPVGPPLGSSGALPLGKKLILSPEAFACRSALVSSSRSTPTPDAAPSSPSHAVHSAPTSPSVQVRSQN
jgi:hypothetical protein